jgi:excisionase family DNA binding protein
MSAGYALVVSDEQTGDEISTADAAVALGVSLDTMRAMIRDGKIPARRTRPGGPYVLHREDVENARMRRVAGMRAGVVKLSEADQAALERVRDDEALADREVEKAYQGRAALVERLGRLQRGTGAMAEVLGVDRSVVQGILRLAEVPVVHHQRHTPLTDHEVAQLQEVQLAIGRAKATRDLAVEAREALTRTLLERGGYGVATEVAAVLGRHRSRLVSTRGKRRVQG